MIYLLLCRKDAKLLLLLLALILSLYGLVTIATTVYTAIPLLQKLVGRKAT